MSKRNTTRPQTRPDELVIPDDILNVLPDKLVKSLFQTEKRAREELDGGLIAKARCQYKEHCQIPQEQKIIPTLKDHQLTTDKLIALAVLPQAIPQPERRGLLAKIILEADQSTRGSYQFIREFLRRNLATMLHQRRLSLNVARKLFPPEVCKAYELGGFAKVSRKLRNACVSVKSEFVKGFARGAGFVGATAVAPYAIDAAQLAWQWFCSKGEFTHFDEVFPALKAIADYDGKTGIAIGVGCKDRFEEIDKHIQQHADQIHRKQLNTKAFRYYFLPDEYVVLMGVEGSFVAFRGNTDKVADSTAQLIQLDFGDGRRPVAISE
jgi:hypothetical protein